VTNEFVKCWGGGGGFEDLSLELGLTKDGELHGNAKLLSDLSMLNRFVGVRDAGHGRARSPTARLSTARSPPGHWGRSL
jgi:hypothetical protein